jgi:hypothetical protein
MAERESRPQGAAPESPTQTTTSRVAAHCRVGGADLPPGHIYCTRVCAMWSRREHLGRELDEPVESWPA